MVFTFNDIPVGLPILIETPIKWSNGNSYYWIFVIEKIEGVKKILSYGGRTLESSRAYLISINSGNNRFPNEYQVEEIKVTNPGINLENILVEQYIKDNNIVLTLLPDNDDDIYLL